MNYTQAQRKTLRDRNALVQDRVGSKRHFQQDIDEIVHQDYLVQPTASLNTDGPLVAKLVLEPATKNMNRMNANQLYKQDFEYKIQQMNNRMQPEIDDAMKKMQLSRQVLGPHVTHKEMLDDIKRREERKVQKLL